MHVLTETVGNRAEAIDPKDVPRELLNLRNVRTLPFALAVFLAVLGMSAIGHSLFTSVRHRRRDFAVYQAMGITRLGTTATVLSQATTIAAVGLAVGVPVGIVAGRFGWQQITDRVPLRFVTPVALVAFGLVVPLAILITNALAVIPSRRASRLKPAMILRSE
jgi:ABC-type antimicrobial peptide transport system permease subunit